MYKSIHPGVIIDDGISLLKTVESEKTGLRLLKSNPENHGDIGQDAIDLSTQTVASETSGATADFSIAFGKNTTANSLYGTVLGISNLGLEDTILEVGIGTNAVPANAFEVYQDGRIIAPSLTDDLIVDNLSLVTKQYMESYADNNDNLSQLELLDEGNGNGWALLGRDSANYGNIGLGAVDLSHSNSASITKGAIGTNSFTIGLNTTASGEYSHAEGDETQALFDGSHSEGYGTIANNHYAHAEGHETIASGDFGSHSEGFGTIALNTASHAAGKFNIGTSNETIHETGIGTGDGARANAFEIYTDGTITAPEATDDLIKARGAQALLTKSYGVVSDVEDAGAGSIKVNNLVRITQEDYDLLVPDPDTLYAII